MSRFDRLRAMIRITCVSGLLTTSIFSAPTEIPALLEPADAVESVVPCPHIAWQPASGDLDCLVQIASDSHFNHLVDVDSIPALTGWYVCDKRLPSGTYYWRIRFATAKGEAGPWSTPRSMKIVEPAKTLRVSKAMSPEAIQSVFGELEKSPHSVRLVFEKGDYTFKPGFNKPVFRLTNASDVVIEGNGSRFINLEPSSAFWDIRESERIVVSGIAYSYDPYPASYIRLVSVDQPAGTFEAEVLAGFDDTLFPREVNQMFCYALNPENPRQLHPQRPGHIYLDPRKTEKLGPHRYRFHVLSDAEKGSLGKLEPEDHLILPYRRWPAGMVARCTDFTFLEVENQGAEGAIFMGGGNKDMKFLGYLSRSIHPPLPGNAWVTGNDRRGPWIEHCVFETLSDDGPNITGNAYLIERQPSPNEFQLKTGPGYQNARWQPGDRLLFWNPQTGTPLAETEIQEVRGEQLGRGKQTILTRNLPQGISPGTDLTTHTHVYNLSCQNAGFVARNNRITDGRRFGFNVKATNAVIEKNRFNGLASSAIYIENEPSGWEGIVGRNIIVQDNTIENCGYGNDAAGLKRGGIHVNLWRIRKPGENTNEAAWTGHSNIRIRRNTLIDWESYGIVVDNIDGCVIENNELTSHRKKDFIRKSNVGIWIRPVTRNIVLGENKFSDSRSFESRRCEPAQR